MFESLERRTLLSFTFAQAGGDLTITGIGGDDQLVIRENLGTVHVRENVSGDEVTFFGVTRVMVNAGAGNDAVYYTGNSARAFIAGGDGDDFIVVNDQGTSRTWADGMAGNDSLLALGTTQTTLLGGAGNDQLEVAAQATGQAFLVGGDGDDTFTTRGGTNTLLGGAGFDRAIVFGGANTYSSIEEVVVV